MISEKRKKKSRITYILPKKGKKSRVKFIVTGPIVGFNLTMHVQP
jgi:hypothetical protein